MAREVEYVHRVANPENSTGRTDLTIQIKELPDGRLATTLEGEIRARDESQILMVLADAVAVALDRHCAMDVLLQAVRLAQGRKGAGKGGCP